MKLKHWMESLSRGARKKSKNDSGNGNSNSNGHDMNPIVAKEKASSRGRRLSVKEIIMPSSNVARGERKYVRDNYPAVAAYLDHRHPLASVQNNLRTFRSAGAVPASVPAPLSQEKKYQGYERLYANLSPADSAVYATPSVVSSSQECGCYRHHASEKMSCDSENCMDFCFSGSGTLNSRRLNIRTNPWIVPANAGETGSFYAAPSLQRSSSGAPGKGVAPAPPPKPQRKRPPPPVPAPVRAHHYVYSEEEDTEMVVCSDKSVGTDGDEHLFEDSNSSCCDCEDCCSSECTSFSSLKFSSGPFFSTDTIQPCESDACSITSTPTILNDFEEADAENSSEHDSALHSPRSNRVPKATPQRICSSGGSSRHHYSPADSHTSWKYFDDDDEVDSGHGQTASSLGSPGSAEDYSRHVSHSSSAQSAKRMMVEDGRTDFVDIDTNIDIIRTRLQKQVYQLKHEQTALDRQIFRSSNLCAIPDGRQDLHLENMIEEDFILQKKAILAETLDLLKRQLDEQNHRLKTSHLALQNLHRRQDQRQEPRNRDCRALSALYNENIRETFC